MSKHYKHKWITSYLIGGAVLDPIHKYLKCEICGLKFQSDFKDPYYHYKMNIYKEPPSCEEIKMQEALS